MYLAGAFRGKRRDVRDVEQTENDELRLLLESLCNEAEAVPDQSVEAEPKVQAHWKWEDQLLHNSLAVVPGLWQRLIGEKTQRLPERRHDMYVFRAGTTSRRTMGTVGKEVIQSLWKYSYFRFRYSTSL